MKTSSLTNSIENFYYHMSIKELKNFNDKTYNKISYNATLYLNIISSTKNCTASFIAEKIGISKAAVTMRINELIEKGLVVKKQSDNDKRINYLFLSKEIEKETNEYNSFFELMTKEIENNYSKDEIDIFCNVLNSFCEID